jgi:hypothetical protein
MAIAALLAMVVYQNHRRFHKPLLTTPFQAVTLTSGAVVYGRVDHLGTDHPVIRDAFTVRFDTDPRAPEPRPVLLLRRDGPTGADHLIVPATAIISVEPVRLDSTVGRLIDDAGLAKAARR